MKASISIVADLEMDISFVEERNHTEFDEEDQEHRWIVGTAEIKSGYGVTHVKIGCWNYTDDDEQEWSAAYEGASIIIAAMTGKDFEGNSSYPEPLIEKAAKELGKKVCAELRRLAEEAAAEESEASA